MKYLCLIYDEESKLGTMPKSEMDAFMGEYFAFTDGVKKKRKNSWVGTTSSRPGI